MFTGKLDGISRAEAKSLIEKIQVILLVLLANLNYLVIGENPTKVKLIRQKI